MTSALIVLGYFELPQDEIPPEEIWHHSERTNEWFEAVKQRRENPDMVPVDQFDVPTMKNEALAEMLGEE